MLGLKAVQWERFSPPAKAKAFLVLLFCSSSVVISINPSSAQETWTPTFNPNQKVYIDPNLTQNSAYPVRFQNLDRQLQQAETQHHLKIYVIAIQGQKSLPANQNWAVIKLSDLTARWRSNPKFPKENYLTILWIRRSDNINKGWVSANGGNQLKVWGLTGQRFAAPEGPVIPALRQYMPTDPQGAIVAIVNNVNQEIGQFKQQQQQALEQAKLQQQQASEQAKLQQQQQKQKEEFDRQLLTYLPPSLMALIALANIGWMSWNFRRRRQTALTAIRQWQERLNQANELYLKLYDNYYAFLKDQNDHSTQFQGSTEKQYQTAVTDFSEFTVRLVAANQRLKEAQSAIAKVVFPFTSPFLKAIALLSSEPIVITGQELPLEMAQLFSGLTPQTTYEPEQLLSAMAELFDRINKSLSEIVQAVQGISLNQQTIHRLLDEIAALKPTLEAKALPFQPYLSRLEEITQHQQTFQAIATTDPLVAYAQSQVILQATQTLKSALDWAINLKDELVQSIDAVNRVKQRVQVVREQPVVYQYPLVEGEVRPTLNVPHRFTLTEEGGDPDLLIAAAIKHRRSGLQLLIEGQIQQAQAEKEAAIAMTERADGLIDAVLAAKQYIEQEVANLRRSWNELCAEIPSAIASLQNLKAEFLPINFSGEPEKLHQAQHFTQTLPNLLGMVRQAYNQQHYLQARTTLEPLLGQAQTHYHQLQSIHTQLSQLQQLRQQSRQIAAQCQQLVASLQYKLQTHYFSTATATEIQYQQLQVGLQTQIALVAQPMTNWVTAVASLQEMELDLKVVDSAIDQQYTAYQTAVATVGALAQAIATIHAAVRDSETRPDTCEQFRQLESGLGTVETAIAQPKSDWEAIIQQAIALQTLAHQVQQSAQEDKAAATEARLAIGRAESAINAANCYYDRGVLADLSEARTLLHLAQSEFSNYDYESAKYQANRAANNASDAQSEAQNRVAAIQREQEATTYVSSSYTSSDTSSYDASSSYTSSDTSSYDASSSYTSSDTSSYDASSSYTSSDTSSYDASSGGGSYSDNSSGGGDY